MLETTKMQLLEKKEASLYDVGASNNANNNV